jgi:hypothetical protein
MYKRNIQRLTQTYLTLSLQDIANTVQLSSPKEAEMHVLQMVVPHAIISDVKHTAFSYIHIYIYIYIYYFFHFLCDPFTAKYL